MPHFGLTWSRLKEHIRKFAAVYLVGCLICGVLSSIVFDSTTPQTPIEQEILIYVCHDYPNTERFEPVAAEMLAYGQENIDETLLEVTFETVQFGDPNMDMYGPMILAARLSLREGDAFIANSYSTEALLGNEVYLPLDDLLAEGWLAEYDFEPVMHTSVETGETHVAALRLDTVDAIEQLGVMYNDGVVLMIMYNSTNLDTTLATIEHMIENMMEGNYAPAQSSESAY
jgi:hypothetical protein